mgnify:CR=1 FL=1
MCAREVGEVTLLDLMRINVERLRDLELGWLKLILDKPFHIFISLKEHVFFIYPWVPSCCKIQNVSIFSSDCNHYQILAKLRDFCGDVLVL